MSWKYRIQDSFEKISQLLFSHLKADEEASLSIDAEDSEFIRFNKGKFAKPPQLSKLKPTSSCRLKIKCQKPQSP